MEAKAPLIVNLGMGVDSVAMLIGLRDRGERPDLVIFADTGDEKAATYAYIGVIEPWLAANNFPALTIVRRGVGRAGYRSLSENCLANETLPSLAFGMKSCSLKWKADAMDSFLRGVKKGPNKRPAWAPAAAAWLAGLKPTKCIGYDNGPKDSKRAVDRKEDKLFSYRYPLREWGWTREKCAEVIIAEGLPLPQKSACYMCPASQEWELYALAADEPEKFLRAVLIEDTARNGKHGLKAVNGLWGRDRKATKNRPARSGSWRAFGEEQGFLRGNEIVMDAETLRARARALKPEVDALGSDVLVQIGGCRRRAA